jgi:predicted GIY-YIG superfamily endonuclease
MTIYVLKLRDGKYYVGKSDNVEYRFSQHKKGFGATWTKIHSPIQIVETRESKSQFDEDVVTKEYMSLYGIDNVRGGTYCQVELEFEVVRFLRRELYNAKDSCSRCGRTGHFVKDCYASRNIDGEAIDEEDESTSDDTSDSDTVVCYRCKRRGHYASKCYARTHVTGYVL